MKRESIGLVAIALLASIVLSCKGTGENKKGDLTFDSITVNRSVHLCNDTAAPNCSLTIKFIYPATSSNPQLLDSIHRSLIFSCFGDTLVGLPVKEAVAAFEKGYIHNYLTDLEPLYLRDKAETKDGNAIGAWYSYYKNVEADVLLYQGEVLTYQLNFSEYTGGAHGMYASLFLNFNLLTGNILHLNDLFKEDYKEELTTLLVNQLMKEKEVTTLDALNDMGYGLLGEILPTENFYLGETGITFFYNVYEIAPYSNGNTHITLTYKALKTLLLEKSVIDSLQ